MHLMQQLFPNPLGEAQERIREKVFGPRQTPGQLPGPVTGGGGGMAIGGAVSGGTASYVLFVSAGPVLAQDASFTWDTSAKQMGLQGAEAGNTVLNLKSGTTNRFQMQGPNDNAGTGYAAQFTDQATDSVKLCDGTYAVNVVNGDVNVPGLGGQTFRWNAGTTAPSTSIGVGIVNFYGSSATNFLGDPNVWLLVDVGGAIYKIPAYT